MDVTRWLTHAHRSWLQKLRSFLKNVLQQRTCIRTGLYLGKCIEGHHLPYYFLLPSAWQIRKNGGLLEGWFYVAAVLNLSSIKSHSYDIQY